ncbi:MAG: hypothetical protein JXL80_15715 [Planctomycetes bacterium]|nr:hypothetical protein [Planctomycetota bacterium]
MSDATGRTTWFRKAGWGVFLHYLADGASVTRPVDMTAEQWNRRVDGFDVEGLADQLASVGAGYCVITVGQCSGFWLAPNATYDRIVGHRPSRCSQRDLVSDLADALAARGIRLMVYAPATAPSNDAQAVEKLRWRWGFKEPWPAFGGERTGERLAEFQTMWESVLADWARRWGSRISGWWVDGVYFGEAMLRHPEPPNYASFAAALRAGNPDALVTFNGGAFSPLTVQCNEEDYTAGESDLFLPVARWKDGRQQVVDGTAGRAQYHVLTYLGQWWGRGEPRFPDDLVTAYVRFLVDRQCVISLDVPPRQDGLIEAPFVRQLAAVGEAVRARH